MKIYDKGIDFLIYIAAFYIAKYDMDWLSLRRILTAIAMALVATIIRILLDPFIDSWHAKRRMRKAEKKESGTSN